MFASNTSQVSSDATYIEDVFSTYLYTGNGSTQTITNGIDLAGKGGLVWAKKRTSATDENHVLFDTARGQPWLSSNTTNAQLGTTGYINYNSNGFGWTFGSASWNSSGVPYASWTFRKQPKFFDVVTYTGNGVAGRTVAHNLGSVPGCIIVKSLDVSGFWRVYHRSIGNTGGLSLSQTSSTATTSTYWNNTSPTATEFTLGDATAVNGNGGQFVAYLFAHNAGGFGLTGTDNVISCGSYTGTGAAGNTVNLGYEPQWMLIKASSTTSNWYVIDNMRGMTVGGDENRLFVNDTSAEAASTMLSPTATGFQLDTAGTPNASGVTYIYIAIRRGPMKTPTTGTSVFSPQLEGGTVGTQITTNFPIDWQLIKQRSAAQTIYGITRLTGVSTNTTEAAGYLLQTASTAAELADATSTRYWNNTGFQVPSNFSGGTSTAYISENFRRAPGFFDVVCYTGTGASQTVSHNLGVVPELSIFKNRSAAGNDWYVRVGNNSASILLNGTGALAGSFFNDGDNTASILTTRGANNSGVNGTGDTYVAYLFASCPGVSKVGSYTGNGSTQTINCGFTGGARFVLIKRTDSTGDWYVWDTARGIVSANDPRLSLNSTAAEVTTDDSIDPDNSGFIVNQVSATNINVSSATYIYLAIA